MRLAIAGSRSLVARALTDAVAQAGWRVTRLGRAPEADIAFEAGAGEPQGGDGVDALVITAASFEPTTVEGMRRNILVNVEGALALLNWAAKAGASQVIYVSSTSAIAAEDSYGLSKRMAEQALSQLAPRLGLTLAIVRPSQIYDTSGEARRHQPFLYALIDRVAAGEDVRLYGSRDVLRNYVHVGDLAEALKRTLDRRLAGTFNAVHPLSVTVTQLADLARAAFASSSHAAFDPGQPDMAEVAIPDDLNLFERVGLTPRPLAEGLAGIARHRAGG